MEYELIDLDATTRQVIKGRVVDTAVVAYLHELELRRLKGHADAGDIAAKGQLPEAVKTARRHRRRAERAQASDVIVPSIDRAIQEALLAQMQQKKQHAEAVHAEHSQMRAERVRILSLDGDLAPTEEEAAEIQASIAINDVVVRDAEIVHKILSADIDALTEAMGPEDEAPDMTDLEIADALAEADANASAVGTKNV